MSRRASRSPALVRSLAPWNGQERAGRREGWARGPAGKGQGGGRSVSVGEATPDKRSKLGRGFLCERPRRARKTRRRTGGRAATPHPACAGTCTAAAPPRPDRPLTRRRPPPVPSGRRPGPRGRAERGKFPGRPRPRAAAPRGPRAAHLAPPRAAARAGQLPFGQLGSARGCSCSCPRPPTRRGPQPLSAPAARPPRIRSRPPGRPALPLRDTALTYAAAATTRPGFPAREGSGEARQPASERASLGDTPPPARPLPQPQTPRAHAACAPPPATRARGLATHPPRAGDTHSRPPVDSGRSISARATPYAHAHLNLTDL